nr:MAG TPA_asm: hypothetical protein [Caudoviricetes sp.]
MKNPETVLFCLTCFYSCVGMVRADCWVALLVGYLVSALVLYLVYRHLGK